MYEVTVDEGSGPVAVATVRMTLLGRQDERRDAGAAEQATRDTAAVTPLASLDSIVRLVEPAPPGGLRMEIGDNVRNSWGALAGGVTSLLAELAAERAAVVDGRTATVRALSVHFLAPGRAGPVDAVADMVSPPDPAAETAHLRVRVTDAGNADRTTAIASAVAETVA